MKHLSIAVLLLFLAPVAAQAEPACRSDQHPTQHMDNRVLSGSRSVLPTLQIGYESAEPRTFGIKGTVCDVDLAPLASHRIELIRFERIEGRGPLSVDDLANGNAATKAVYEAISLENGTFVATGLPAGDYALRADWDAISDSRRVVFDVRVVPGPSRQSPVAQTGLLQPR
jgi:hypothetical protein